MRKLLMLMAAVCLMATACSEEDPQPTPTPPTEQEPDDNQDNSFKFINGTNTTPTIVAGGGTVNIAFQTDYSWSVTSDVNWTSISLNSGNAGTASFFVVVEANKTDKERTGMVTITLSSGRTYTITITQEPSGDILNLVCQNNEILYTTKYNYALEKSFAGGSGFGNSDLTACVEEGYRESYGFIKFSNDVTKIPDNAFENCTSVVVFYLPDGVQSIGHKAFAGCNNLRAIISNKSTDDYRAVIIDGCLCAIASADLTSFTIPEGVTSIAKGVFSNSSITKITIPSTIKTIGDSTFMGCSSLTNITISEGVTSIGASAFEDCENLTRINIPSTVKTIGNSAFKGCTSRTGFTIPEGVTSIGTSVFEDCKNLSQISIPSTMKTIGDSAFEGCTSLFSIILPEGVTSIGANAFKDCAKLSSFKIPEGVGSLGTDALSGCSSLKTVDIHDNFYDFTGLFNMDINQNDKELSISLQNCAVVQCTSSDKQPIEPYNNSSTLLALWENGVSYFIFENNIIPSNAFQYNTTLTSVTIPDAVTYIGYYAFESCTSLKSVTIGNGVTEIGEKAFYKCSLLRNVYCNATTPPHLCISYNYATPFTGCNINFIDVPNSAIDAYKSAWANYDSLIK